MKKFSNLTQNSTQLKKININLKYNLNYYIKKLVNKYKKRK